MSNKKGIDSYIDNAIWFSFIALISSAIFSIALLQIFTCSAVILWIFKIIVTKNYTFVRTPLDNIFLIFIAARILSIPLSLYPEISSIRFLKEIIFYTIFFVVTNEFDVTNRKRIILILRLIVITGMISSVYGCFNFLTGSVERAASLTGGYYTLGIYLTLVLSILLFTKNGIKVIPSNIGWYLSFLVIIAGIICTLNRMHWVIMVLLTVISFIINKDKILISVFLLSVILSILIVPDVMNRFNLLINLMSNTSDRNIIYQAALDMIFNRPVFGHGLATFKEIFPAFDKVGDGAINSWHNDFIQVYMESGIVGLISYIFLIISIFKTGFISIKRFKNNQFYKFLSLGILIGTTVIMITGGFFEPITSIIVFLLLGILALILSYSNEVIKADC
ncbi:MAG TPA: O-antigen ligase family protein [Ignavibacteria bacterium]|nr:O-antigen ligase family protein [Ignavibacteria bacterium]HRJ98004.1 O-antigen ligase family protein [Ignavibacteria bacterium]